MTELEQEQRAHVRTAQALLEANRRHAREMATVWQVLEHHEDIASDLRTLLRRQVDEMRRRAG